jgi:hypothetical protein
MNYSLATKEDNVVWQRIDDNIMTALYQLLEENNNIVPSHKAIAKRAKCDITTVSKHLKNKTANDFIGDFIHYLPAIINKMKDKALSGEGDVPAANFVAKALGLTDKQQLDVSGKIDTTLQIAFVGANDTPNEIDEPEFTVINDTQESPINTTDDNRDTDNNG